MKKENKVDGEIPATDKTKKIKRVEIGVLSVLLALVIAAVGFIAGWFGRWGALGKKKQSLLWAIDTAEENYYREIDEDAFYENLFAAFAFDRYSSYYSAKEYETIAAEREGQNSDAGFSVFAEENPLQVYSVASGSSAADALITAGMYFLKYGKTDVPAEMQTPGSAEDYFAFVASLAEDETYYVLCGTSTKTSEAEVYTLTNGKNGDKQGAGLSLTRKYDPMRIYQVVGNSPADKAKIVANGTDGAKEGLKRGMYILKFGKSKEDLKAGSSADLSALVSSLEYDKTTESFAPFYMQCSFDKEQADAPVYEISMKKDYQASYCVYRDSTVSYRFRNDGSKGADGKTKKPEAVETGEPIAELDSKTAYIALSQFTGNAAAEFRECLSTMKKNNRTNLILDLRGSGGGYMDVFAEIASCLMRETTSGNPKVAYAKFKNGATVSYSVKRSTFNEYFSETSRVSILADEYTASASECLIGALVDYKTTAFSDIYLRQNESGEAKTYGKGIMQTHYDGPDGSILKLTSAEIFWPKSDKSIHGVGVVPSDGANAIESSLLPDANDSFLQDAIKDILKKGGVSAPSAPAGSYCG